MLKIRRGMQADTSKHSQHARAACPHSSLCAALRARRCWSFCLNPGLAWSDVSLETRLRLKTLPVEAVSSSLAYELNELYVCV
jgi:hypothetical protein